MNMDKIYELILKGNNITFELLLSNGYKQSDIDRLVKIHYLCIEDGYYYPDDVDNIYAYFKEHVRELEYDQQLLLLDMVLYLKPTHGGALFQKFYVCLKLGDHYQAFDAFAAEYKLSKKDLYRNDSKLQLLLLSKLVNVGDLQQDIANLTFDDIKVRPDDSRYSDKETHNEARKEVLNRNYQKAFDMLYLNTHGIKITFQELVFKTLLNRIIHEYQDGRNYKECILDGRYEDALYSLSLKEDLNEYDQLAKKLLEFLLFTPDEIVVNLDHQPGLWESIEACDFETALELNRQYNLDKRIDDNNSPISILLREILYMISQFDTYSEEEYNERQQVEYVDEDQEEVEETEEEKDLKVYYISELLSQDISFEEALEQSGFNPNTKSYITLVFAREAFIRGNVKIGDRLLSMYNRSVNKNEDNNKLYKNIMESKKFLSNRTSSLEKPLTMPKKLTRTK